MKMKDIKIGTEYAVGLRAHEKRSPRRAVVKAVGVERKYSVARGRSLPVRKTANDGVEIEFFVDNRVDRKATEIVVAAAIIKPWAQWADEELRYRLARKEHEAQEKRRRDDLNERLQAVQDALPEGDKVQWRSTSYGVQYGAVVMPLEAVERLVAIEAQYAALLDTGAVQLESTVAVFDPMASGERAAFYRGIGHEHVYSQSQFPECITCGDPLP
jgi:hypothetical protein